MSSVQLKCDNCGDFYQDNHVNILCEYCDKKQKQVIISEFVNDLKLCLAYHIQWCTGINEKLHLIGKKWEEKLK